MTWIECRERMPEPLTALLVCCMETDDGDGPYIEAAFLCDGRWISQGHSGLEVDRIAAEVPWPVTHWRPLPLPPGEPRA